MLVDFLTDCSRFGKYDSFFSFDTRSRGYAFVLIIVLYSAQSILYQCQEDIPNGDSQQRTPDYFVLDPNYLSNESEDG